MTSFYLLFIECRIVRTRNYWLRRYKAVHFYCRLWTLVLLVCVCAHVFPCCDGVLTHHPTPPHLPTSPTTPPLPTSPTTPPLPTSPTTPLSAAGPALPHLCLCVHGKCPSTAAAGRPCPWPGPPGHHGPSCDMCARKVSGRGCRICGVVWCCHVVCAYGVVWCGVMWWCVVWCGVVSCGGVWCGVVWCHVVVCGVVWCEGACEVYPSPHLQERCQSPLVVVT